MKRNLQKSNFPFTISSFRRFDREGEIVLDLGDTVRKMKREFGVHKVLTWHAMSGYWAGVDPEARGMAPFEPRRAHLLAPEGVRKVDPEVSSNDIKQHLPFPRISYVSNHWYSIWGC